jgi:methylenetetrahydrofolate reductase (NADPH)
MRDHLPGVLVPDRVIDELEAAGAGGAAAAGVQLTVDIVRRLKDIEGIAGVHVMGMGHEDAVRQVIEQTELLPRPTVG